jgi:hypothetical protein
MWSDKCPLRVGQGRADQGCLPFGSLESASDQFGNPQTSTRPSHRAARDIEGLGQLRRGAFLVHMGQQVQDREMRDLHSALQGLADQVARQLLSNQDLDKKDCSKPVIGLEVVGIGWFA